MLNHKKSNYLYIELNYLIMEIVSIHLHWLRNSDYLQYMTNYLRFYEDNDPVALGVEDEFNALTAKAAEIDVVFKQDQASALTEEIANLDALRDKYLVGIAAVAKGYFNHYDESKVQMGKKIDHHISVYGGTASAIGVERLQGQTATLKSLIDDFQNNPELSAALTTLGLMDWVGQLELANNSLDDAYVDRAKEKGDMPADKIKDLRLEGNALYYALREMMKSRAHIAGYAAPYDVLITGTNSLTQMYNDALARGGSTREEGGEDDIGQE